MAPFEHRHDRFELVYFFLVAIDTTVVLTAIAVWLTFASGHWAYLAAWALVTLVICAPLRPYVWALRNKDQALLRITADELIYKNHSPIPIESVERFEPTRYKLWLTYRVDGQNKPGKLAIYPLTPSEKNELETELAKLG